MAESAKQPRDSGAAAAKKKKNWVAAHHEARRSRPNQTLGSPWTVWQPSVPQSVCTAVDTAHLPKAHHWPDNRDHPLTLTLTVLLGYMIGAHAIASHHSTTSHIQFHNYIGHEYMRHGCTGHKNSRHSNQPCTSPARPSNNEFNAQSSS